MFLMSQKGPGENWDMRSWRVTSTDKNRQKGPGENWDMRREGMMMEIDELTFDAQGLIPCVVQQYDTGEVLMVAWMSAESLRLTRETGTTWFWSRSRQELWNKGATSGNMQQVREILADCDADTLLVKVDSPGPACHTGARSCFFNELD